MGSVISKGIDLALEYMVAPVALQVKYTFCYSSYIKEMKDAVEDLERNKKIIDDYVNEDTYNGKPITGLTDHWLGEVEKAQKEVQSLQTYEKGKTKINACCAKILINPIARNKLGRKAANEVVSIKDIVQGKPPRDVISSKPEPRGIVKNGLSPEEASQQINIVLSSSWNDAMKEVMTALKDDTINVVGLHGMGGVGKSTMINEVHVQVFKQSMFDLVAKVEVKAEVDIMRIQEEIASALGLTLENNSTAVRAADLRTRLLQKPNSDQKKKQTVLIILDDLVEKLDLQVVGIPSSNDEVQIKLLLTSRDEYLLSDKMRAQPIHLDVLSNLDALEMFKIVAGLENAGEGAKKYEKAKLIVPNCGGLPVVILAIANALKNKALKEWDNTLQRLDVTDTLSNLEVSYEHLPSQESKHLFLLCGIIRGPRIQVRDLLKYTFGLGLYERKDIYTLTAAATELEKLLSGLKAASMLLKGDDLGYVYIHDRMRDLAIRIVDRDLHEWGHFTLRDDRREIPRRFDASKLELILSYCDEGDSQLQVPDSFFRDMKKLYVLAFKNLTGGFSLPSPTGQIDHLCKLETLCLHKCSLSNISMIGELKGLRILSFRGSDICKIPLQLRGLTALKMLDLSDCEKLTQIEPTVFASLTKLEELNMENGFKDWEIEGSDATSRNARLLELRNLSRLSNVRIHIPSTSMLPKDGKLFSSNLTTYQIMFGVARYIAGEYVEDSDCYLKFRDQYNTFSRVLMLTFDLPDILWQDWVQATLQTAEVLYLSGRLDEKCKGIGEICIKGFECLKHLQIRNCPSFQFIISSNDSSSTHLESLTLENLENLERLCDGLPKHDEAFNKLRIMDAYYCDKLMYLFDFSLLKTCISSQLEEITVNRCAQIQCIIVDEGDNNYDVVTLPNLQKLNFLQLPKLSSICAGLSSNVLFTGKKVAFPRLKSLIIAGLDELEHIWHPTDPPAELGNLRRLEVQSCDKLVCVVNSNVLMRVQQHLESLRIDGCKLMKQVFDVDDEINSTSDNEHDMVLFSRLKDLRLQEMKGLEGVHNIKNLVMMLKSGMSMTIFPNIEFLLLSKCPHLRYVLCCSLPTAGVEGGYANLKEINIADCEEMEAIVEVMLRMVDQQTQQCDTTINSASSIVELVLFLRLKQLRLDSIKSLKGIYITHNLRGSRDDVVLTGTYPDIESLDVSRCHGLKYVLSWSSLPPTVGGLMHLRKIRIEDCERMEAIVQTQPAANATATRDDAAISSYSYFSLKEMEIYDCPQLRVFGIYGSSEQDSAAEDLPFFSQKEIFPCLEMLFLGGLSKLGEIWSHDVPPQSSFKMLKQVSISTCPTLSAVFPSTLVVRLENLTGVRVQDCDYMMQIIIVDDKNSKRRHAMHGGSETPDEETSLATKMEMMFTLPCLRTLVLHNLGNLDRFNSSPACSFQFPSLETLAISSCSGVKTLFSHGSDTDMVGALFRSCDRQLAIPNLKSIELQGLEGRKA